VIPLAASALATEPTEEVHAERRPSEPLVVLEEVEVHPHGFVDVGWFWAAGPSYRYVDERTVGDRTLWVYHGDPWTSTVNSQGDPADLGAFNNLGRLDPVHTSGHATALVNAVEAALELDAETTGATAAVWAEPRSGTLGAAGDLFRVDRAYVWWRPNRDVEVHAGQIESAFGLEWWDRRAPTRVTITPSLVARYATGTTTGVGVDADLLGRRLHIVASVSNGSPTTERFGHLHDDLDSNAVPTGAARVALHTRDVTVGVSGLVGAQDGVAEPIPMLQVGADAHVAAKGWFLDAEYLVVDADGAEPGAADRLFAHGGYALLWAETHGISPFARVDRRQARLEVVDVGNLYLSDVVRTTAGLRWKVSYNLIAKVEYTRPWELAHPDLVPAPTPLAIPDDVACGSLVFHW
jgi:hypothetical protein